MVVMGGRSEALSICIPKVRSDIWNRNGIGCGGMLGPSGTCASATNNLPQRVADPRFVVRLRCPFCPYLNSLTNYTPYLKSKNLEVVHVTDIGKVIGVIHIDDNPDQTANSCGTTGSRSVPAEGAEGLRMSALPSPGVRKAPPFSTGIFC